MSATPEKKKTRLGVLVSGRGSNLQAIIEAIEAGRLDAEIAVVISDHEDAYALERARKHGLEALHIDPAAYPGRENYDRELAEALRTFGVELVVMAGFMRILSPVLIRAFPRRIMNIHPALLPCFPGLHVQRRALEHGVRFSGCTVHFVDEGVDTGPIIIQAVVPVLAGDTEETLSARILRHEHRVYARAIQLFAEGRLEVSGRRVTVKGAAEAADHQVIVNPLD